MPRTVSCLQQATFLHSKIDNRARDVGELSNEEATNVLLRETIDEAGLPKALQETLQSTQRLPTPPMVVVRLLSLTRERDVSSRDIAETISLDPTLAAKILRFVNSPMAGLPREVTSLTQAVALIGVRGVTTMALSIATISSRQTILCPEFRADVFPARSLACGVAARTLATMNELHCPQESFVAGLLSQIGRLALACAIPETYSEILASAAKEPRALPERERAVLGGGYPEVGAWLLREWGIPEGLCTAIEAFRDPVRESPPLAQLLHVAEIAAEAVCPDDFNQPPSIRLFMDAADRFLGLGHDDCLAALNRIAEAMEELRAVFELSGSVARSTEDLEADVRERLAELNVAMHLENQSLVGQQEELMRRATTDALTDVGNRAAFDARLSLELARAARSRSALGLLMIDVDHFNAFNDTHGHQAGDRVLQAVARILNQSVRKVDYVARYGGEEFAVIAPDASCEGISYLAERLRHLVEQLAVRWETEMLHVTISIGAALFTEVADAGDTTSVIRAADAQLYAAKHKGRNRVEVSVEGAPERPAEALAVR